MSPIAAPAEHSTPEAHNTDIAVGESIAESFVGLAAVVLSILGLLGALPRTLSAVATMCGSAALLLEGGAVATRLHRLARALGAGDADISGGLGAESIAGVAGVLLGLLSLLGFAPLVLLPVATIVLGAGLLLGSAAMARVNSIRISGGPASADVAGLIARESVYAASGAHVLAGLGMIVLGILALLGVGSLLFTLVAMLSLGGVLLLSGAAIGGRLLVAFRH